MTTNPSTNPHSSPNGLTPPFTLEQLRADILNIYLLQLRTTFLFSGSAKISDLAGKKMFDECDLWTDEATPSDFGITYEDIQDNNFAKALEQQYSFGFYGIHNQKCEPMEMYTMHTHVAAYVSDASLSGSYAAQWEMLDTRVDRLLHVCELANARIVLEGGEDFLPYMGNDPDAGYEEDTLTIHQMALLAGMEEMTIRTAISRKSANQLESIKADRRTLIRTKDAIEWLKAKGKYVPVTYELMAGAELNLEKIRFTNVTELIQALGRNLNFIAETRPESNVREKIKALEPDLNATHEIRKASLLNVEFVTKLAAVLDLPVELLVLRAREAVLTEELAQTTEQLLKVCRDQTAT